MKISSYFFLAVLCLNTVCFSLQAYDQKEKGEFTEKKSLSLKEKVLCYAVPALAVVALAGITYYVMFKKSDKKQQILLPHNELKKSQQSLASVYASSMKVLKDATNEVVQGAQKVWKSNELQQSISTTQKVLSKAADKASLIASNLGEYTKSFFENTVNLSPETNYFDDSWN